MKALRWIIPVLIVLSLIALFIAPAFCQLFTYHRVDETAGQAMILAEQEKLTDFGSRCVLMLPILFILWLVYAICGRRNMYRKSIAKLLGHLCLMLLAAVMAFCAEPKNDTPALFMKLFWTCFPYGILVMGLFTRKALCFIGEDAVSDYIEHRESWAEFKSAEQCRTEGTIGLVAVIILGALCGIVGIISCPIVLITDVVAIIRLRRMA